MALKDQKLNNEELEEAAGGYIFNASVLYAKDDFPWQVIDYKGEVVCRAATKKDAIDIDKALKASYSKDEAYLANMLGTKELSWDQLQKLRKTGKIY